MRYTAAAMLVYAIGGKVFSPQYLLWVLPFVAVLPGRTGAWTRRAMLPACVLTAALCPWSFRALVALEPWAFTLLNLRNILLVATWAWLLWGPPEPANAAEAKSAARDVL
jgi:hypothetical protein